MGGDGGTMAVQRSYLPSSEKKDGEDVDKGLKQAEELQDKMTKCRLTGDKLRLTETVCCCPLGDLYNKEDLLEHLLEGKKDDKVAHIRLKDLVDVTLTKNPTYDETKDLSNLVSPYVCPITQTEMNVKHPFCVLKATGQVVSMKAVKEVPEIIPEGTEIIELFPSPERRKELLAKFQKEKKNNKKKNKASNSSSSSSSSKSNDTKRAKLS